MNIKQLLERDPKPTPWSTSDKLPWNEPDFSRRMLHEHLRQDHDMASPRAEKIDKHVEYIHAELLSRRPTRILDLGCGPGLYTSRLAKLGHTCVGVDFSPASIEYARNEANDKSLDCTYIQKDIREPSSSENFGLVMMLHGEMNTFSKTEIREILKNIESVLDGNGILLLTASTVDGIRPPQPIQRTWESGYSGIFLDEPYLELNETIWDSDSKTSVIRYFIVNANTGNVTEYSESYQAYTNEEYEGLFKSCGFADVNLLPPLSGMKDYPFCAITILGRKEHQT